MRKNNKIDIFLDLGLIQVNEDKYLIDAQNKVFDLLLELNYSKFKTTQITSCFISICKYLFAKDSKLSIQLGIEQREHHYFEVRFFIDDEIQHLPLLDKFENVFILKEYSITGYAGNAILLGVKFENTKLLENDFKMISIKEKIETRNHNELLVQLKEANQKMEVSLQHVEDVNNELEAFSYSVSHDLRAPLRHMVGFAELLKKRIDYDDEKSVRFLENIILSSKRMGNLIDDLLQFSRTGRTAISLREVNANNLVAELIEELVPIESSQSINWDLSELPVITADYALIRLVFQNLISNAIKYSSKKEVSEIKIGFYNENKDYYVFYVKDNGAGFDMQYSDKLFGVFSRLHKPEEFEGTGIGLANVKRIVHKHNGKVWAIGKEDKGAIFYFKIPTKQQ